MVLSLGMGGKSVGRDLKHRDNPLIIVAASKQSLTMTNTSLTIQMKTVYSTFRYLYHSVKELVNLQGSYIRAFLQPGISHLGVLTSGSDADFAYLLHRSVNRYANWAFTTFAQIYSPVCTNLHHFCAEQI